MLDAAGPAARLTGREAAARAGWTSCVVRRQPRPHPRRRGDDSFYVDPGPPPARRLPRLPAPAGWAAGSTCATSRPGTLTGRPAGTHELLSCPRHRARSSSSASQRSRASHCTRENTAESHLCPRYGSHPQWNSEPGDLVLRTEYHSRGGRGLVNPWVALV